LPTDGLNQRDDRKSRTNRSPCERTGVDAIRSRSRDRLRRAYGNETDLRLRLCERNLDFDEATNKLRVGEQCGNFWIREQRAGNLGIDRGHRVTSSHVEEDGFVVALQPNVETIDSLLGRWFTTGDQCLAARLVLD
jgi:hypothetical protein